MRLRLLFLDDDEIQNDIMSEYVALSEVPSETKFVQNGYEAINYLKQAANNDLPHVMFIDVFMPLIDGWETLTRLEPIMKARNWFPAIYVLTSSVSNKDRGIAEKQEFMKAFLNKPLNLSKLKPILQDEHNRILSYSQ